MSHSLLVSYSYAGHEVPMSAQRGCDMPEVSEITGVFGKGGGTRAWKGVRSSQSIETQ